MHHSGAHILARRGRALVSVPEQTLALAPRSPSPGPGMDPVASGRPRGRIPGGRWRRGLAPGDGDRGGKLYINAKVLHDVGKMLTVMVGRIPLKPI